MKALNNFLNNYITTKYKVWDEWTFYSNFIDFHDKTLELKKKIDKIIYEPDYIVGLSKSGLPLASLLSYYYKKPLIPFSIGELFSPDGSTTIGIPNYDDNIDLSDKNILVCDSHVKSGETLRLFSKITDGYYFNSVHFAAIANCDFEHSIDQNIISLYSCEDIESFLKTSEVLNYSDPFFWKHSRSHWLIPPDPDITKINISNKEEMKVSILDQTLSEQAKTDLIIEDENGNKGFSPLLVYLKSEIYENFVKEIVKNFDFSNIDTIVACSLASIPLAVRLCVEIKSSPNKTFIYMGNGDKGYYEDKFKNSKKIIFCDDVISSGALQYRAHKTFIKNGMELLGAIVFMHQKNYPFRNYISELSSVTDIYTLF